MIVSQCRFPDGVIYISKYCELSDHKWGIGADQNVSKVGANPYGVRPSLLGIYMGRGNHQMKVNIKNNQASG